MRRAAASAFAFASLHAAAAFMGVDEARLRVHVVDESGKPVAGAFVVAREFTSVPQVHGSRTFCFRGDVARAAAPTHVAVLPGLGMGDLGPTERWRRAVEAFAYLPGYCVERSASARAEAFAQGAPSSMRPAPRPDLARAGGEVTLRARAFPPGREERLQYLLDFSAGLVCGRPNWSERSRAAAAALGEAMVAEATSIARDRYEKSLVERLRARLAAVQRLAPTEFDEPAMALSAAAPPRRFARDFLVGPANMRVSWGAESERPAGQEVIGTSIVVGAPSAQLHAVAPGTPIAIGPDGQAVVGSAAVISGAPRGGAFATTPPRAAAAEDTRLVIHCRHGPPSACDLDERDMQGLTAIAALAAELKVDEARALLEAGANPSVAVDAYGNAAVEMLVQRIVSRPPARDSAEARNARALMALLARDPRATIAQPLHDDLAADPATWLAQSPDAKALLLDAREAFAGVRTRPEAKPACERIETATELRAGVRLRLPR